MSFNNIDEFVYCMDTCHCNNRYEGWCSYYRKDLGEIDDCEYCKKQLQKMREEHERIITL